MYPTAVSAFIHISRYSYWYLIPRTNQFINFHLFRLHLALWTEICSNSFLFQGYAEKVMVSVYIHEILIFSKMEKIMRNMYNIAILFLGFILSTESQDRSVQGQGGFIHSFNSWQFYSMSSLLLTLPSQWWWRSNLLILEWALYPLHTFSKLFHYGSFGLRLLLPSKLTSGFAIY